MLIGTVALIGIIIPLTITGNTGEAEEEPNPLESLSDRNNDKERLKEAVVYISNLYGIDSVCYDAIIEAECQYRPRCNEEYGCSAGDGLIQLIESTRQHCSDKLGREIDPMNDKDALECGAWLLANEGTGHWGREDTEWGSWDKWHTYCN